MIRKPPVENLTGLHNTDDSLFFLFNEASRMLPAWTPAVSDFVWGLSDEKLFSLAALREWAEVWIAEGKGPLIAGTTRHPYYNPVAHMLNLWLSKGRWPIYRYVGEWGHQSKEGYWMSGWTPPQYATASTRLFVQYNGSNASHPWRFPSQVDPLLIEYLRAHDAHADLLTVDWHTVASDARQILGLPPLPAYTTPEPTVHDRNPFDPRFENEAILPRLTENKVGFLKSLSEEQVFELSNFRTYVQLWMNDYPSSRGGVVNDQLYCPAALYLDTWLAVQGGWRPPVYLGEYGYSSEGTWVEATFLPPAYVRATEHQVEIRRGGDRWLPWRTLDAQWRTMMASSFGYRGIVLESWGYVLDDIHRGLHTRL